MKKLLCMFAHDWSVWSPVIVRRIVSFKGREPWMRIEQIQGRSCFRCGKITERSVALLCTGPLYPDQRIRIVEGVDIDVIYGSKK